MIWPNLLLQHWTGEHVSGHPGLTPVHPVSSYYSHPAFLPHARDIREAQAGMQVGYQVGTKWLRRVTAVLVQKAEKDSFSLFPLIGWFSAINRPLFTTWCQSLESGRSPIAAGGAKAKSPLRGWDLESTDTRVIIIMQTRLASFPHSCQRNSIHMENEFAILTLVQFRSHALQTDTRPAMRRGCPCGWLSVACWLTDGFLSLMRIHSSHHFPHFGLTPTHWHRQPKRHKLSTNPKNLMKLDVRSDGCWNPSVQTVFIKAFML